MTIEISPDRQQRALHPPAGAAESVTGPGVIVRGARVIAVIAAMSGVAMSVADLAGDMHLLMPAFTAFLVGGQASVILCVHAMLADRQEFFRRGQLEGWYRGYRMQPPEISDPLLR